MRRLASFVSFIVILIVAANIAVAQRPLTGVWETDGYGNVLEFTADSLKTFEITKISCLASDAFVKAPTPPGARGAYASPGSPDRPRGSARW